MFLLPLFFFIAYCIDCQLHDEYCGFLNSTYFYCSENSYCLQGVCGTGIQFSSSPNTELRFSDNLCVPNWVTEFSQNVGKTCSEDTIILYTEQLTAEDNRETCGLLCLRDSTCASFIFDEAANLCTFTSNCERDQLIAATASTFTVYIRQDVELELCDVSQLVLRLDGSDETCAGIINFSFVNSNEITEAEMCECFTSESFQPSSDFECKLNSEKQRWVSTTASHCSQSVCTGLGYNRLPGGQMDCPIVSTSRFQPLISCASICSNQTSCIGFSYDSRSQLCHRCLSTAYSLHPDLSESSHLSFYYKQDSCSCNTLMVNIRGDWKGFVMQDYTRSDHMVWASADGSLLYSEIWSGRRRWTISDEGSGHLFRSSVSLVDEDTLLPDPSSSWLMFPNGNVFQDPISVDGMEWECSISVPSASPTASEPTFYPSKTPTASPSTTPTLNPTSSIPTLVPSNLPSTSTSSILTSTQDPSAYPTVSPTTSSPTTSTNVISVSSTTNDDDNIEDQLLLLVFIVVIALLIICGLFLVFLMNNRADTIEIHKSRKEYHMPAADIEMMKIDPSSEERDETLEDSTRSRKWESNSNHSADMPVAILNENEYLVAFNDHDLGIGLSNVNYRGRKEVIVSGRTTLHSINHIQPSSIVKRVNNLELTNMSAEQVSQVLGTLRRPLKMVLGYPRPKDDYNEEKVESSSSEKLERADAAQGRVDIFPFGGADMDDADESSHYIVAAEFESKVDEAEGMGEMTSELYDHFSSPVITPMIATPKASPAPSKKRLRSTSSKRRRPRAARNGALLRAPSYASQTSSHIFKGAPITPMIPFLPSEPDVREEGEVYDVTFFDDVGLELIPAFLNPIPQGAKVVGRYSDVAKSKVLANSIVHSVNNLHVQNLDHKVVQQLINQSPRPVKITFIQPKHVRKSMTPPLVADDISENDLVSDGSQYFTPSVPNPNDPNIYNVVFYNDDVGFTIYTETGYGALVGELETAFAAERILPDSKLLTVNDLIIHKLSFEEIKTILMTAKLPLRISFLRPRIAKRFAKNSPRNSNYPNTMSPKRSPRGFTVDVTPPTFHNERTNAYNLPLQSSFNSALPKNERSIGYTLPLQSSFNSTPGNTSHYNFTPPRYHTTSQYNPTPSRRASPNDYFPNLHMSQHPLEAMIDPLDVDPGLYEAVFDQHIIGVEILPNPVGHGVVVGQLTTEMAQRLVITGSQIARVGDENVINRNSREVISMIRSAPRPLKISFIRPETFGAASFKAVTARPGQAILTFTEPDLQLDLLPGRDGVGAIVGTVDEDGPKFVLNHMVYRVGKVDVVDISFNQIQKLIRKLNRPLDVVFQDPEFYFPDHIFED